MVVNTDKGPGGIPWQEGPALPNFVSGLMVHNALHVLTTEELSSSRGRGVFVVDPGAEKLVNSFSESQSGGPRNVRALAVAGEETAQELWVGTFFDGVYRFQLPGGNLLAHYTTTNTGIKGQAEILDQETLRFRADAPPSEATLQELASRVETGLYLRLNTETFQVKELRWPQLKVVTYPGSHDLTKAGANQRGLNQALLLTGLSDDTVNDILIEGDTVWLATGLWGDKGLAGGLDYFRQGQWGSRHPDVLFNERSRFHWQRSNAAFSLCRSGKRLWSGWAELRGLKPWGGVSGNLLNFRGEGQRKEDWQDFTRPMGVDANGFAQVLHTTVTDLAPLEIQHGRSVEACVVAGTVSMNNPLQGMGWPERMAGGGGGLRMICERGLVGLVAKTFQEGRPTVGSPPSNAIWAVATATLQPGGKEIYALAGTDAGLLIAELTSQLREYFYQPPPHPWPLIKIGSNYLLGKERGGEVLYGTTVGAANWPACLPDLAVQDVQIQGRLYAEQSTIWVATYSGLARYQGPFAETELKDCRRWQWYCLREEKPGFINFKKCSEEERKNQLPVPFSLPISSLAIVKEGEREKLVVGTGVKYFVPTQGEALRRVLGEAAKNYPERPITHLRVLYSTFYEGSHENLIMPASAAINLYTEKFHQKPGTIAEPESLAGDTTLNWKHLDQMTDRMVALDLTPTFCFSTLPFLLYRDLVREKGRCSPPDPRLPECAPSRQPWNFQKYENLIFALVDHFYRRYGRERVASWTLEVWNEPAISWLWPWPKSWADDYVILYEHAQKAVQACDHWWDQTQSASRGKSIRLAGPAWHGDPQLPDQRLQKIMTKLFRKERRLDLVTVHLYPFVSMDMTPWYQRAVELIQAGGFSQTPLAVTEYGMVMGHSYDAIGTSASSEQPALFLLKSLDGLSRVQPAPEMMYGLDIQSPGGGSRSNWPGVVGYLGTRGVAPRPLFNLMLLASQAGEVPLETKIKGDLRGFARRDPRTGQIMIFAYHTNLRKPWKETINYWQRGEKEAELIIRNLSPAHYHCQEFKIDGKHANLLTALWRNGSPEEMSEEIAQKIKAEAELRPLPANEKSLPETVTGNSLCAKVKMEEESIYVAWLTPSPILAESFDEMGDLEIQALAEGDLVVSWREGDFLYEKRYEHARRLWQEKEGPKKEPPPEKARLGKGQDGEAKLRFNSETIKLVIQPEREKKQIKIKLGESVSGSRFPPEELILLEWEGKNLAWAVGEDASLHLLYGTSIGLTYQKLNLIRKGSGEGVGWSLLATMPRPVSAYAPFPASQPEAPALAVEGSGRVHLVWIEKNPSALGAKGKEAVVYTCLRR